MNSGNKKTPGGRSYVGGNTFTDGMPVCKPVVPGRCPKPLEGPVHPGFKGKPKPPPKVDSSKRPTLVRSSQNDDVYKPVRPVQPKTKKK